MGKKLNETTKGKEISAKIAEIRETVNDFIGDSLAQEYSVDTHLAEISSGIERITKKKYLYITIDGVQLQIQVTAKEKPVELTNENILATYTTDSEE